MAERLQQASQPLVSIGIPTYNRAEKLRRAAESVLAQTYRNIELVISDDGSDDDTEAVCHELCRHDARVRYLRSPVNRGLTANYNALIEEMHGDYVALPSDDDWLSPDYVERCLKELQNHPDHVLVCGLARYLDQGKVVRDGLVLNLDQPSTSARVVGYLRDVGENGLLSGIIPRAALIRAAPMRNVLSNDWLLVMAIIAQGKAATLPDTFVMRELGGTSANMPKLVRTLGLHAWQARLPHVAIAVQVMAQILRPNAAFTEMAVYKRWHLSTRAAIAALDWRSDAWHLATPSMARLAHRPRGRIVWALYRQALRMLGSNAFDGYPE